MLKRVSADSRRVWEERVQAGHEYALKDVLQSWGLPDEYHAHMSAAWKCVLAPICSSERDALLSFLKPEPVLAAQSCGQPVLDETGANVFEYLVRPAWDNFPRPRFAMLGGWGSPGTPVTGDEHVGLVSSFSEILSSTQPLNLQVRSLCTLTSTFVALKRPGCETQQHRERARACMCRLTRYHDADVSPLGARRAPPPKLAEAPALAVARAPRG
jgi:hypothetical protein